MATLVSSASTPMPATLEVSAWWLEDPDDHDADVRLWMASGTIVWRTPLVQGVFQPKGATRKVVISRSVLGKETTLVFGLTTEAALDAWEVLVARLKTLRLKAPMTARQWWVQIVGAPSESMETIDYVDPLRTISADVIEVEAP